MAHDTEFFCIHGFLGSSYDWQFVTSSEVSATCFDLYSPSMQIPQNQISLSGLGDWINEQARTKSASRILVGYSLGGRIALHALFAEPELWDAAVIISAHPGLTHPSERTLRLGTDAEWARRFATDPWEPLLAEWNAQPIFKKGSPDDNPVEPVRQEQDFNRTMLAKTMSDCSLGHQIDFRPHLRTQLKTPLLWVTGAADSKYSLLAQEITGLNPLIRGVSIPQAGHRVLFDQPQALLKAMSFLVQ